MSALLRVLALAFVTAAALPAPAAPRIFFFRTMPPSHPLGGEDLAFVHASGDPLPASSFIQTFVDRTNRSGLLRVETADSRQLFARHAPDAATMRRLRRLYPRATYLAIDRLDCRTEEHSGEGSTRNSSGERVKRHHRWIDATCQVRIRTLDRRSGAYLLEVEVKGEGTSPRVVEMTAEESSIAVEQAAHFAAVTAAELVAPRQIRESIGLDESVPDFAKAAALIDAGRLVNARQVLEAALRRRGHSAALHFDIAAISEAMDDIASAGENFDLAVKLAPHDSRYRYERTLFHVRSANVVQKSEPAYGRRRRLPVHR